MDDVHGLVGGGLADLGMTVSCYNHVEQLGHCTQHRGDRMLTTTRRRTGGIDVDTVGIFITE